MIGDTQVKDWVGPLLQVLTAGGVLTGIYMLLKLRPEAGQITVTAAQGALVVQTGVLETLRDENKRLAERVHQLEKAMKALSQANHQIEQLKEENERLTAKVSALEREVTRLRDGQEGKG